MAAGGNREQKQCVLHEGEQRVTTPHSQVGAVGNWGVLLLPPGVLCPPREGDSCPTQRSPGCAAAVLTCSVLSPQGCPLSPPLHGAQDRVTK